MRRIIVIALLTLAVPTLFVSQTRDKEPKQRKASAKPCEVVIAGMYHEYLGRSYRPAHLRALYEAVRPTVIAIEAAPSSMKSGVPVPPLNENYEAMEYGRRAGIPVTGADWEWTGPPPATASPPAAVPRAAGISETEARRLQYRYVWSGVSYGARSLLADVPDALAVLNSATFQQMTRDRVARHEPYPGFYKANDTIASNILTIARERCAGGRLLVTFGSAHRPELERQLASAPEIRLRPVSDWLPLAPAAVAAQERPEDLWKVLGMMLENLEMLSNPDTIPRDWIREQSSEMEQRARTDLEAKYYLARWLTVAGEWERAASLLHEVAQDAGERTLSIYNPAAPGTISFWPPETNLQRRALFALGLVKDLAGQRDSAVSTYRQLKSEIEKSGVPQPSPGPSGRRRGLLPWLDRFIAEPYTGHPDQYLRVLFPD